MKRIHFFAAVSAASFALGSVGFAGEGAPTGATQGEPMRDRTESSEATPADAITIVQVEEILRSKGYDAGPVDGVWDSRVEAALQEFQQAKGLDATGQIDEQTLLALHAEGKGRMTTPGGEGTLDGGNSEAAAVTDDEDPKELDPSS
jgi:hypothetical protein